MTQIPSDSKIDTSFDSSAMRERLLSLAASYAESLKCRPGLVGILLYGSLVRCNLTQFSDIDIALFYEGNPPYGIEHELVPYVVESR